MTGEGRERGETASHLCSWSEVRHKDGADLPCPDFLVMASVACRLFSCRRMLHVATNMLMSIMSSISQTLPTETEIALATMTFNT